jgi:hypothetical protein
MANQYGSVVVVPLDDRPIATSRRLLMQVGTVCRPTGWRERPMRIPVKEGFVEGSRIIDVGTSPWRVEKARGEIAVRNPSITKATVLDANGMPVADLPITKDGSEVKLALPENALYVCLEGARYQMHHDDVSSAVSFPCRYSPTCQLRSCLSAGPSRTY